MGKKIIKMTESDLMKLIKRSLMEEMEDVDLGDRTSMDSESDWSQDNQNEDNDVDTCIADLLSYDEEDGPVNPNIVIHKAVFMAAKLRHFENNYDPAVIASALIQALDQLKQNSIAH
jgi:hypothetical protein